MHALNHFADSPPRRWAAFIAGDENIFFPALVALVSLEESNPGVFDRYISFDGSRKTSRMDELLARYNVKFIDIHEVNHSERALALAQMHQGQWPVEISMNWALPEHLHLLGYANSIRFDYDTLSIGNFNTAALDRQIFSVVALKIEALTDLPESTIARSREMLGLDPTHVQAFQPGVVVFNNSYAAQFRGSSESRV